MAKDTVCCVIDDDVYEIDAEDIEDAPEEGGFYAPEINADGSYIAGECPDFYYDFPAFDADRYEWDPGLDEETDLDEEDDEDDAEEGDEDEAE